MTDSPTPNRAGLFFVCLLGKTRKNQGKFGNIRSDRAQVGNRGFWPLYFCGSITNKPKTKITMLDKIAKSNKIMALVSILTLAIVAYVLVYKPWKAKKETSGAEA